LSFASRCGFVVAPVYRCRVSEIPPGGAPLVSIGVPGYNAEGFIVPAVQSLLGQDVRDLEVVVLPEWRLGREYVDAVPTSPLSAADRARCLATMGPWTAAKAPSLARNVARTGVDVLRGRVSFRRPSAAAPADAETESPQPVLS
jgi:hypothetical protein